MSIDDFKVSFILSMLEQNEEDSLYWGYKIYLNDKYYDIFELINDMFVLFYEKSVLKEHGLALNEMVVIWEETDRTNHTILGSIIKNLVNKKPCFKAITEIYNKSKTTNTNEGTLQSDTLLAQIEEINSNPDYTKIKYMTKEELTKQIKYYKSIDMIKPFRKFQELPRIICTELKIPIPHIISFHNFCEDFNSVNTNEQQEPLHTEFPAIQQPSLQSPTIQPPSVKPLSIQTNIDVLKETKQSTVKSIKQNKKNPETLAIIENSLIIDNNYIISDNTNNSSFTPPIKKKIIKIVKPNIMSNDTVEKKCNNTDCNGIQNIQSIKKTHKIKVKK
jgi:hypothetical protein